MISRRRLPPWVVLAAIVVASAAFRIVLGREVVGPWIMVDELIYSELAKSFAATGHFQVRGVASNGYGFVYPALIAPAWKLFGAVPTAYDVAKAINAVAMSLAAIPAYFLARRILSQRLALVAATLTVLVPGMLYTSELMTENVFYPLFLCVVLALVVTLERPTWRRQVLVLVLCGIAYATRQQAVALVPAVAVAPFLLGLVERDLLARLRAWLTTYAILAVGVVAVLAGTVARGRSPLSLLGAYRAATSVPYSVNSVLHYLLWHVAELDLYVGFIPFAALLAIWLAPRSVSPATRAFAAATFPVTLLLAIEVALFASTQSGRIEERNLFYVAPLFLVALAGLAEEHVVPRRRWVLLAAALVAGVLPVTIPLARFVNTTAISDTFGLLPWWWVQDHGIHFGPLRLVVLGVGLATCAVFVALPRRYAPWLAVLVAAYFGVTTAIVQSGSHGIVNASKGNLWAGIHATHRNWVDRAVGRDADVTALWTNDGVVERIWNNEFFNRSIKQIVDTGNAFSGGLPEQSLRVLPSGKVVDAAGKPFRADYVLTTQSAYIAGKTIASDSGTGMILARVDGPLFILSKVTGTYPNDTWAGKQVTYVRRRCERGYVSVTVQNDPALFPDGQVVTASSGGQVVATTSLPASTDPKRFVVPLTSVNGTCTALFTMRTTRVPAKVEPGSTDTRQLGAHFLAFEYLP
ncbi:MAG TPA: glycosyltransferase family 39 protein [Gaiellaceae bacterium]|nr:glycosyltransferase family 39 protein [Gaiellaceae bacterium]